jgi:hypothetical protein
MRIIEKMRESFVFYESFYLALSELSAAQQGKIYTAICRYALYGEEPELKGASAAVFKLIKPQIDANNRRYENGKKGAEHGIKGGRPKNPKETPKEPQANPKETPNVHVNVNENVNENDNAHATDNGLGVPSVSGGRYKVEDEFNLWKKLTPEDIDILYEKFPNSGGLLIDEVFAEVKAKKTKVKSGLNYILGYAKKVGWDDDADHFDGGGMS